MAPRKRSAIRPATPAASSSESNTTVIEAPASSTPANPSSAQSVNSTNDNVDHNSDSDSGARTPTPTPSSVSISSARARRSASPSPAPVSLASPRTPTRQGRRSAASAAALAVASPAVSADAHEAQDTAAGAVSNSSGCSTPGASTPTRRRSLRLALKSTPSPTAAVLSARMSASPLSASASKARLPRSSSTPATPSSPSVRSRAGGSPPPQSSPPIVSTDMLATPRATRSSPLRARQRPPLAKINAAASPSRTQSDNTDMATPRASRSRADLAVGDMTPVAFDRLLHAHGRVPAPAASDESVQESPTTARPESPSTARPASPVEQTTTPTTPRPGSSPRGRPASPLEKHTQASDPRSPGWMALLSSLDDTVSASDEDLDASQPVNRSPDHDQSATQHAVASLFPGELGRGPKLAEPKSGSAPVDLAPGLGGNSHREGDAMDVDGAPASVEQGSEMYLELADPDHEQASGVQWKDKEWSESPTDGVADMDIDSQQAEALVEPTSSLQSRDRDPSESPRSVDQGHKLAAHRMNEHMDIEAHQPDSLNHLTAPATLHPAPPSSDPPSPPSPRSPAPTPTFAMPRLSRVSWGLALPPCTPASAGPAAAGAPSTMSPFASPMSATTASPLGSWFTHPSILARANAVTAPSSSAETESQVVGAALPGVHIQNKPAESEAGSDHSAAEQAVDHTESNASAHVGEVRELSDGPAGEQHSGDLHTRPEAMVGSSDVDTSGYSSDVDTVVPVGMNVDVDGEDETPADESGGYSSDVDSLPVVPSVFSRGHAQSLEEDGHGLVAEDSDGEESATGRVGDDDEGDEIEDADWSQEDRVSEGQGVDRQVQGESPVEFGSSDIEYDQAEVRHGPIHGDSDLNTDDDKEQLDPVQFDEPVSSDFENDYPKVQVHPQAEESNSDEDEYCSSDSDVSDANYPANATPPFTQASPPPTFSFSSNPAVRAAQEAAIAAAAAQAQADVEARAARATAAAHEQARAARAAVQPPQVHGARSVQTTTTMTEVVDLLDSSDDEASTSDQDVEYDSDRCSPEANMADERGGYADDDDLMATSESEQEQESEVEEAGAVAGKSIRNSRPGPAYDHVGCEEEQECEYEDEEHEDLHAYEDDEDGPDPNEDQQYLPGFGPSAAHTVESRSPTQSAVAAYWQQQQVMHEGQHFEQQQYYNQYVFAHAQAQQLQAQDYQHGPFSPSPFDVHESSPFAHAQMSHGLQNRQHYTRPHLVEQEPAEYEDEDDDQGEYADYEDEESYSYDEDEEDQMVAQPEPDQDSEPDVVELLLSSSDDEVEPEEQHHRSLSPHQQISAERAPSPSPAFSMQPFSGNTSPAPQASSEHAPPAALPAGRTRPPPRSPSPVRATTFYWPSPPPNKRPRLLFTGSVDTSLWSQSPVSNLASSATLTPSSGLAPTLRHGFGSIGQGGHGNEEQDQDGMAPEMEMGENGYLGSFVMGIVNRLKRSRASAEIDE